MGYGTMGRCLHVDAHRTNAASTVTGTDSATSTAPTSKSTLLFTQPRCCIPYSRCIVLYIS